MELTVDGGEFTPEGAEDADGSSTISGSVTREDEVSWLAAIESVATVGWVVSVLGVSVFIELLGSKSYG